MMWLKGCPRCNGDVYEDRSEYGRYVACLQCGHDLTEAEETFLRLATARLAPALQEYHRDRSGYGEVRVLV